MTARAILAGALVSDLALRGYPGMSVGVAHEWLDSENSSIGSNPLGILASTDAGGTGSRTAIGSYGRFAVYSSDLAGIDAAAYLLTHGSYWSGILSAVRSGNAAAQRAAIIASPWAGGHYNNGASWAYSSGSGSTTVSAPAAPMAPNATLAAAPMTTSDCAQFKTYMRGLGISDADSHAFSADEAMKIANQLYHVTGEAADTIARRFQGRTVAQICAGDQPTNSQEDVVAGLTAWVGQLLEGLGGLAVNLALLVVILVLAYSGLKDLAE